VSRSRLSPTSLAVLGLLALRPWSAYQLTQQIHRSLRYMHPASERNLYAEPKRLAAAGLVQIRQETAGRRSRTVYEITPAGRDTLRRQMATPTRPPQLEFDAMQRLVFADQGSKQDLLATLDATSRQIDQLLHDVMLQLRGYQADGGPFPERLHLIMLFSRFYVDYLFLMRRWTVLAGREVASWPTTKNLGLTDGTRQILEELLQQVGQLSGDPEHVHAGRRTSESPAQQAAEADGEGLPVGMSFAATLLPGIERLRLQALTGGDTVAAAPLHADDYWLITPNGSEMTKDDYLGAIASGQLRYQVFEPVSEMAVLGDGTVAVLRYRVCISFDDGPGRTCWHTDCYRFRDGRWQVVWSQATEITSGMADSGRSVPSSERSG
jgi:PadR family transcriptional regulator, regulatory protein AphA